ncbi:amidohydrolase [Flavihumibacter rivuli]|uniref:amidohydrolase n=1 Tax=Flavihumibacter rivuli TaxID=2838156 RepID=UPI001BDEEC4E|nr:amidohydrolase [Flavihumibacter rivuli]ULQ55667.1 amidohydrolase [Flavihumibacter rivuli]
MYPFRLLPFLALLSLASCRYATQQVNYATAIYKNAKVWTGDSSNRSASVIAVKDSVIIYVGNNADSLRGPDTEVVDVSGQMILPGFIDNHSHFISGGYQLASVDLKLAKNPADFITILKDYAAQLKDDRWIQGGNWDHEGIGGKLPTRYWIDSISGNHPVFVSRYDGHMALANSLTLKLAGINRNTPDPPGGEIVRDPRTGEPTGVLKDAAMDLVYAKIPPPSAKELEEMLQRATAHALEHGITQVHDVGSYGGWTDLEAYRRARTAGSLSIRIYSMVPVNSWRRMVEYVRENGKGDDMLHWGALKGFVDGSLGSTTAWFYQPYLDELKKTGLLLADSNELRQQILSADSAGLQPAIHAIGDRAIDWVLDVFAEAQTRSGKRESRFRVEHSQHLSKTAIDRFAAMKVIPSMQPYHAIDDGRWASKRLDDDRLKRTYAFKSLLDAGARVTFGSDWVVAPLSPIEGINAAVNRQTLDGKHPGGWYPEQRITVEQALRCYTVNNAYAAFLEKKTGMLKPGMLADFVVLSDDLLTLPPAEILTVKVTRTILNGKLVYEKQRSEDHHQH